MMSFLPQIEHFWTLQKILFDWKEESVPISGRTSGPQGTTVSNQIKDPKVLYELIFGTFTSWKIWVLIYLKNHDIWSNNKYQARLKK